MASRTARRRYPLHAEIGLALALGLAVLAFTVPTPRAAAEVLDAGDDGPIVLVDPVALTVQPPPPPPPPAPPPPVEVPDQTVVEDEVIETLELALDEVAPVPPGPPPAPAPPPAPTAVPEPPPVPEPTQPDVFTFAEVQPELIGGLAGLQGRVEYPEFARRAGIEGQVVVQFVVDERGNVVDPVVLRSPNELLSEAALEAVRESRFTPGQQRGRPVKVRFAVPVTFRLR